MSLDCALRNAELGGYLPHSEIAYVAKNHYLGLPTRQRAYLSPEVIGAVGEHGSF